MRKRSYEELTQMYASWGDKLLSHADVLHRLQEHRELQPITVQLAPCEACDSDCPFCSVSGRPLKSYLPYERLVQCLRDFRALGAKSVEITGGGNPLLYRDRMTGETINDVVQAAAGMGYAVGVITNASSLACLDPQRHADIAWVRVSLIKLDEGREPEDYDLAGFPASKVGFSYIIYGACESSPRLGRSYAGTTPETIRRIARLVELHPEVKFVRLAGDCLAKGVHPGVRERFETVVEAVDQHERFFLKTVGDDDGPFDAGCYVGAFRPYVAAAPDGGGHRVYICTSHVLNTRTYDERYALGPVEQIPAIWARMTAEFRRTGRPYAVDGNQGCAWGQTCKFCYYKHNNRVLHTVAHRLPDWKFA